MKLKDALARIEELEKRVQALEARQIFYPIPYMPAPCVPPWYPNPPLQPPSWYRTETPVNPMLPPYTITYGGSG